MLMVLHHLGHDHYVWDKAADIEFVKPGRGTVQTAFALEDGVLDALRAEAADGGKVLRWFENSVVDAQGETVARVRKQLYVRRKPGR
jgi:hypothetical protein